MLVCVQQKAYKYNQSSDLAKVQEIKNKAFLEAKSHNLKKEKYILEAAAIDYYETNTYNRMDNLCRMHSNALAWQCVGMCLSIA